MISYLDIDRQTQLLVAAGIAVGSIVVKESLYQFTVRIGKHIRSKVCMCGDLYLHLCLRYVKWMIDPHRQCMAPS